MTPVDPIHDTGKPTEGCIRYQPGFKYQLCEDAVYRIPADLLGQMGIQADIVTKFVHLSKDGVLLQLAGFAWNGVSGPTIDRATNKRGGCFHDGLCRLIRFGCLKLSARDAVDEILRRVWIEDGMYVWLANTEVWLMKKATDDYVRPSSEPEVLTAP